MTSGTTPRLVIALALSAGTAGGTMYSQARSMPAPRGREAVSASQTASFRLEEATIADVHRALQQGELTCQSLVQDYLARARAYNGTCNQLFTEQMADEYLPAYGEYKAAVDATAALPSRDPRKTPPLDFGRMEPTASDPNVQQQFGMSLGIPNAGPDTRAQHTQHPRRAFRHVQGRLRSEGRPARNLSGRLLRVCPAPRCPRAGRGARCDLRSQPRPGGNADVLHPVLLQGCVRHQGHAIHRRRRCPVRHRLSGPRSHARGAAPEEGRHHLRQIDDEGYNGLSAESGRRHYPERALPNEFGYQRSTWAGTPCNPYDTTRAASLGSSAGSGGSVSTNIVMCGLCEETRASCRGPANHNAVALILPHKALISFLGGGIGSDIYNDRAGIHCRTIVDSAKVLDALKDAEAGYYDPRDIFTTIPRSSVRDRGVPSAVVTGPPGALRGMRIGIVREFMVKHSKAHEPDRTPPPPR